MIKKSEIESKAKEFEIHPTSVEKDYVFGWVLYGMFTISDLKDDIFLKGGNALRKGYFENTRFSSDLDFGIPYGLDEGTLAVELDKICDFIQEKSDVTFIKEQTFIEEKFTATETPIADLKVWDARIYFRDFQGNANKMILKVSMDITRFDKVLLPIQAVSLIHPYSDKPEVACQIRCMKLEEIIATKMKCLHQRQHAPDLFDYVYSIQLLGGSLNKEELIDTFVRKTIFARNPHAVKESLQKMSFEYFRNTWEGGVICAKQISIKVEEAIEAFLASLEDLFSIYPINGYRDFAFFPADMRVKIMEAGRNQTMMRLRYNGADRVVEPYSLKYLESRKGLQREYFFAYNSSGGNNDPGIRMFVNEKIESIENTEEKFKPRFQVELSKAGELPENKYLFDPNKPAKAPRAKSSTSRRSRLTQIKYVYQCNSCGKKFIRTTMDGRLNPHKSKQGYNCGSRFGFYVTTKY